MKVHFLGTAAAEGFPAMFCRCVHCLKARELGGKNVRTRSSVLIDGVLKVDFPPDTLHHVLTGGIDLGLVKDLFITHTHLDHLRAEDLEMRMPVYAHGLDAPLHVYGHDAVIRKCREAVGKPDAERLVLRKIDLFETVDTGNTKVTALPANHDPDETCLLFLIEKDGKRIFYGHDTGLLPEETWRWLEQTKLDLAILDCTNGHLPFTGGHLNIAAVLDIRNRLRSNGIFSRESKVVVTHFSHNIGLLHDDLTQFFDQEDIIAAFDGMVLQL